MKNIKNCIMLILLVSSLILALSVSVMAGQETVPTLELPVFTTSAGQSADINTLNIVADEAGLKYDYCDVPSAEMVASGVGMDGAVSGPGFHVEILTDLDTYPVGTPYKTIVLAIGASLKGMGASGLTLNDEVKRVKGIIDYCKKNNIYIIATHLGGLSARGPAGSDNETMIDAVAPFADYIIITKNGNEDGRFTKIAEDNNSQLTEVDYALDLIEILKVVFQLGE